MQISHNPLPYEMLLDERKLVDIELLVIHCTELPNLSEARLHGEKILYSSGTGNSGHYYIDVKGHVSCWVKPKRIAHHVKGHNKNSIGIELDNKGRYPDWFHSRKQQPTATYPIIQIEALNQLIGHLEKIIPSLKHIVGHEDLDTTLVSASDRPQIQVRRKIDPGLLFPWDKVMQHTRLTNIGLNAKQYL